MTHPAAYLPINIGERVRFEAHGQSFLVGYHSRNTYWLSTDPPGQRRRWGTRQEIVEDIAYVFENGALPPASGQMMWAGEAHRYAVPPEPPHHFVAPRGKTPEIIFVRVGQVERVRQGGRYEWHDGYSENGNTYPWLTKREAQQDARRRGAKAVFVEPEYGGAAEPHVVADFGTLDDLLRHASQEGATHVLHIDDETHLYFRRLDGGYEKAEVWQKDNYWHTQGPGSRAMVQKIPRDAETIGSYLAGFRPGVSPGRTAEAPRRDKSQAGGGTAGAHEARRSPRGGSTRRISTRAPAMTPEAVMRIAADLARKVGGLEPDLIEGGFRWGDQNVAAQFTTHSPEHGQKVVVVISLFADGTIAQDFFSDEYLSELNRYESIAHFLYSTVDFGEMAADLKWVWETVDGYAESWQENGADLDEAPTGRSSGKPFFGRGEGAWFYAIKIDGIANDFPLKPLGRQEEWPHVQWFMQGAKHDWISAKHATSGTAALKRWVKAVKPDQFYAKYSENDDSIQVWYTGGELGVSEARRSTHRQHVNERPWVPPEMYAEGISEIMLEVLLHGMGEHASGRVPRPGDSYIYDRDGYNRLLEGGYIVLKRKTEGLSSFGDYFVLTDKGADLQARYRLEVRRIGTTAPIDPSKGGSLSPRSAWGRRRARRQ